VLKTTVIGGGSMGRHHARILASLPGSELVGVVEPDAAVARANLSQLDVPILPDIDALPACDAAVVATPTLHHVEVALALIERGVSVLVEKPLAATPEEARTIVEAAEAAGVTLAVGHVERFNPAIRLLAEMTGDARLLQFERLSPYTPRIRDSVVFDLMVHDLDLACWMAGGYPVRVQASGAAVFSESVDVAAAILEFDNGVIASLECSRATQDKVRRIAVSEPERYLVADSIRQDVSVRRQAEVSFEDTTRPLYRQASVVEIPYLDRRGEPLALELTDFLEAVERGTSPCVDGRAGLAAVELATAVERAITPQRA
jgi:predicted dehydrogenase